jgi:hypothetical protein
VSPRSVLYTRGLCKKFRQRFPDLKIIAGLWTRSEETTLVQKNVGETATRVTTKIADGMNAVRELVICSPTVAA